MAKGRHNKPRAFALGLLCHMKNYLCIYRGHKTKRIFKREPENDGRT